MFQSALMGATQPANRMRPTWTRLLFVGAAVVVVIAALIVNSRFLQSRPVREHLQRGALLQQSGKLTEAEQEWRAAMRLDPSRPEPYQLLSVLYLQANRPEDALPLLEQLRKIAPQSEHVLCSLAEAYSRTDKPDQALETARQAVLLEPKCPRARALLGVLLAENNDLTGAIENLRQATALAPNDDKIATSLGQAQWRANAYEDAEKTARDVVNRNPKYATAWYLLGRAFADRPSSPKNRDEAIKAFTKATELAPDWTEPRRELDKLRQAKSGGPSSKAQGGEEKS